MSEQRLKVEVEKRFGDFRLRVDLSMGKEVMVLFGPSGAGKTQTLNAIAGLMTPDRGEIALDGATFFRKGAGTGTVNIPSRKRRVGYVFQSYALFPHLNAVQNVAYPLQGRGDATDRAMALLRKMHLSHISNHYPRELSGGQQQRVAISRALAASPQILLLDEPFSALDISVKERLQQELRQLQSELDLVVVYVTHNMEDVFAVGDRLAVVHEGAVQQVGPVAEVFRNPASETVLRILGIRNVFTCKVVETSPERNLVDWDDLRLETPPFSALAGDIVSMYIYPQDVKIVYPDRPLTRAVRHNQVSGLVMSRQVNADSNTIRVRLGNGHDIDVKYHTHSYIPFPFSPGEDLRLSLRRDGIILLKAGRPRGEDEKEEESASALCK